MYGALGSQIFPDRLEIARNVGLDIEMAINLIMINTYDNLILSIISPLVYLLSVYHIITINAEVLEECLLKGCL